MPSVRSFPYSSSAWNDAKWRKSESDSISGADGLRVDFGEPCRGISSSSPVLLCSPAVGVRGLGAARVRADRGDALLRPGLRAPSFRWEGSAGGLFAFISSLPVLLCLPSAVEVRGLLGDVAVLRPGLRGPSFRGEWSAGGIFSAFGRWRSTSGAATAGLSRKTSRSAMTAADVLHRVWCQSEVGFLDLKACPE